MRAAPKAFTLVELLVVIGIIALLISILLPALGKARAEARGAVCLSNMRQIYLAMQNYSTEWKGKVKFTYSEFPTTTNPLYDEAGTPLTSRSFFWSYKRYQYSATTSKTFVGEGLWKRSGMTGDRVVSCPGLTDVGLAAFRNDDPNPSTAASWQGFTGYAFNPQFSSLLNFNNAQQMKGSAQTVVFADSVQLTFAYNFSPLSSYFLPWDATNKRLNAPSFQGRHRGRCSILWLDGHASLEPLTLPADQTSVTVFPTGLTEVKKRNIGFVVRNQEDLTSAAANYLHVPTSR